MAEDEQWRVQCRINGAHFRAQDGGLCAEHAPWAATARWRRHPQDTAVEDRGVTRLTLDVPSERFFEGLAAAPRKATRCTLSTISDGSSPSTFSACPDCAAPMRWRLRPALWLSTARSMRSSRPAAAISRRPDGRLRIFTLLLAAEDPKSARECEAEVRANIITFIAGHETTANAIAWCCSCSQSAEWCGRVRAEWHPCWTARSRTRRALPDDPRGD
jgi:cytochrome P450